ncbi:Rossmann-fold NAD(P)-binding domain-containing protein [Chitinophaga flava]|uniref:NAD(P)-dependent oxidoreductase n=1 Tax=Chitinophaga flava TaxID=2259036 RepID=A0A365XY71_9BACT|nr:SDR family NAD(P)-dependent oxidoreductase [Chitinophaga flava]RBL91329.1 NAD(P)-dependent oxidoreductase [Chitinophaga flava]
MDQHLPKISILSCGWLGKPLAQHLQRTGYTVKGARTTAAGVQELQEAGIDGYQVVLSESQLDAPDTFWDADILIINIPPRNRERGTEAHVQEIKILKEKLETTSIKKVIFVSSTSVYADVNDMVTEHNMVMPETPNGIALREVEQILLQSPAFRTTVLRFGGLIGYDRIPNAETLLTQRRSNDVPMNVIHRDDCIGIISLLLEKDIWGEIFNACASVHPIRYHYYRAAAQAQKLEMPKKLQPIEQPYKIVSSAKLKQRLGYEFIYDDPLLIFNAPTTGTK